MPDMQELILIEKAKQGDITAFEQLYQLYKTPVFRTAYAITGEKMLAEEILQEAFLRAFRYIHKFYDDVSLLPWLYRVTVNLAYDYTSRRSQGSRVLNRLFEKFVTPFFTSPERQVEETELQQLLYKAINNLEFKQRTTLVLFYLQDFSLIEIADIMDCPVGTVKSRLHNARKNLKGALLADEQLWGGLIYDFTSTEIPAGF